MGADDLSAHGTPPWFAIAGRRIGAGCKAYIIGELSANHHGSYDEAARIVEAVAKAGADAVKLQTYTPDGMTLDLPEAPFLVRAGTLWAGRTLHDLYHEAMTPWEWQPRLKRLADDLGIHCFSSAFDADAVDFLEDMAVPAQKIASFEIVDLELVARVAATGKPLIVSTGMASLDEIGEALATARAAGATQIALLKCTSAYPAPIAEMNLRGIPFLRQRFGVPVGLSDHTLGHVAAVAAVAVGACILEKHVTLSRSDPGPDSAFSLEPDEFRALVEAVRAAESALGEAEYRVGGEEQKSRAFRRSLFVVADLRAGEMLSRANVAAIRPGDGLPPRELAAVLGRVARVDIARGTPLSWELVE